MPQVHIYTPEELAEREKKPRGRSGRRRSEERVRAIEFFKAQLQGAQPGYGGEVLLEEGEEKRTVRQNLKIAAQELGLALAFRPIKDRSRIQFRVITPEEAAARPRRRGGRPPKRRS
ncbi:hypothetical protein [Kallotenue papyrolyticum]|uniref:hypothetical protein n=1 Tax=Kallotenue papyrolyticum TaxID=1325125 RepID=UPI00047859E6|nr:hypothetical protein [Kallotenue papyrolyticum]